MWEALQHAGWVTTLAESRPLYGLVSIVHFSSVFLSVGTIVLLDLRILGIAARSLAASALAFDNIGLKTFAVIDVQHVHLFVFNKIGIFH